MLLGEWSYSAPSESPSDRSQPRPRPLTVRAVAEDERTWLARRLDQLWGSSAVVSRGKVHHAATLPALLCEDGVRRLGIATFVIAGGECELVTLDAFDRHRGVGSALLSAVALEARRRACARVWLITTNDNLQALRFYQRRSMRLVAVHRDAVAEARRLKPMIPMVGEHGIEIRDELELELRLE